MPIPSKRNVLIWMSKWKYCSRKQFDRHLLYHRLQTISKIVMNTFTQANTNNGGLTPRPTPIAIIHPLIALNCGKYEWSMRVCQCWLGNRDEHATSSSRLKASGVGALTMSTGRLFHGTGSLTQTAACFWSVQWPNQAWRPCRLRFSGFSKNSPRGKSRQT